jgi:hypothetical protein
MSLIYAGLVMGFFGTVAMDLWALLLNRLFGQPMANWARVGRWVAHLPERVFHEDFDRVAPVRGELAIGWAFHYAVGLAYGVIFALLAGRDWLAAPGFLPVWLWGIVTIAGGWFLLQPAIGAGWAAARTPDPARTRVTGLVAHTVFALGMWGAALLLL